jgi:hypothetical protein
MMKFFAQVGLVCGVSFLVNPAVAATLSLSATASVVPDVPPGFKRMLNGTIVVVDPLLAVAPVGFRINESGELIRDASDPAATTLREMEMVEARKAAPQPAAKAQPAAVPPVAAKPQATTKAKAPVPAPNVIPNPTIAAVAVPVVTPAPAPAAKSEEPIAKVAEPAQVAVAEDEVPPGFHRMADGTLMANQRDSAVAPPGYHLMPDGTLMPDTGDGGEQDHSAHMSGGGMWMLDYKFERTQMNDLLDTTTTVTPEEIVRPTSEGGEYGFMMSPTDMSMEMHMFMLMYHGDKFMAMVMAHYMFMEMGMLAGDGTESTMKTSGFGDTIVSASFPGPFRLSFNVGVSIPTGSIDEHGSMTHSATFTQENSKYPYSMQLGSGTYDLIQGISYEDSANSLAWGAGYEYKGRFQKNSNDYKLGDELRVNAWTRWKFMGHLSATGKLQWLSIGQIEGEDEELNAAMSPDMDAEASGGRRLDIGAALRYETDNMTSVTVEFAKPIYQNLWGPQLKTDWIFGVGVGIML